MRVEHKNMGLISVDRSQQTTFRTYNTRIHKYIEHTIHKNDSDNVAQLQLAYINALQHSNL